MATDAAYHREYRRRTGGWNDKVRRAAIRALIANHRDEYDRLLDEARVSVSRERETR